MEVEGIYMKTLPNVESSIEFVTTQLKEKKLKKKEIKALEGILEHLSRHKLIYYDKGRDYTILDEVHFYRATIRKEDSGNYSVSFRHPVVADNVGDKGRTVHRSLRTKSRKVATRFMKEIQELLKDEYWWKKERKEEASALFSPLAIDIFYYKFDCVYK